MDVYKNNGANTFSPKFSGKFRLSDMPKIVHSRIEGKTNLDAMFYENPTVRAFEGVSIFIKKNIAVKYFDKSDNFITKSGEFLFDRCCRYTRIIADRLFFLENKKHINKINEEFVKVNTDSPEYIEEIAKIGNSVKNKYVNINLEDNPLENIANSKSATIFIMNHPNFHKDKFSYVILNSLINKMYIEKGAQNTCPRPKILVSQNMLKIVKQKIANIYTKFGMIPINGRLDSNIRQENNAPMIGLMRDFINDKANIFIFPEGRNSAYSEIIPIEQRIQPGIAKFINSAANQKKYVKVIPVGLSYTDNPKSMGNIFIGKPLFFKKDKSGIIYTTAIDRKIAKTDKQQAENTILNEIKKSIATHKKKAEDMV